MTMSYKKKLIEVALPLEVINKESARDKFLSSGHPTTLHYWWAPRPLAACRAVVFAALVDDPSSRPEEFPDKAAQDAERNRLFEIMVELVKWESRRNRSVLEKARGEIARSTDGKPPKLFDPFCGRGLIPFEGQRLGLGVLAADLNPVPVAIAKTLIEIVPKFLSQAAVNPITRKRTLLVAAGPADGFAADVKYYAQVVLDKVRSKLKPFYPEYVVTPELVSSRLDLKGLAGKTLTVIGWLWARTARCSNPACVSTIPLVGSFWLSKKENRKYWLEPTIDDTTRRVNIHIKYGSGSAPPPTKLPRTGGTFRCPACGENSDEKYLEQEGKAGRIGSKLMACIADGGRGRGRIYLPATREQEHIALSARPEWRPEMPIPHYSQAMPTSRHGVNTWADLFTNRQLMTLNTLATEIRELRRVILNDAVEAGVADDGKPLEEGGSGAQAYADGIVTFLSLVLGKQANRTCAFNFWDSGNEKIQQPFAQQGIQKTWDYVESNLFCDSSGSWVTAVDYPVRVIREYYPDILPGCVFQQQVADARRLGEQVMVITDPPYYDNMGYADLSDFFYVWHRRSLRDVYPQMFSTVLTPKAEELAAIRHRFGGDRRKAEEFFVDGFQAAFRELSAIQQEDYPLCFFYAYKQKEARDGGLAVSTGWETMLRGLIDAGLCVTGTWPVLSESTETIKKGKSSLSTSIVLVCRKRPADAPRVSKREFLTVLKAELPQALTQLQQTSIAPVDLDQASIGPGMAVFSRYHAVLEPDGSPMSVRTALALINQVLGEFLVEQDGEYDADTRWALTWFEQHGFDVGKFGVAETLSKAKNTSIQGMDKAGILVSAGSSVRLQRRDELDSSWDPSAVARLTVWEALQYLIRALEQGGEMAAAIVLARVRQRSVATAESVRDLAYRLFAISERRQRVQEELSYNGLIVAWPQIEKLVHNVQDAILVQGEMFE